MHGKLCSFLAGPHSSDHSRSEDHPSSPALQDGLPRIILAELQRLPSARSFPPILGSKRDRGGADGGAVHGTAADVLRSLLDRRPTQPPSKDPTASLLSQAASQLSSLVKQQMHRRMLLAAKSLRRGASEGDSEAGGSAEGDDEAADAPRNLCGSFGAANSAAQSPTAAPYSLRESLDGPSTASGKRACLQRQYAIDLSGRCLLGSGKRVPLPQPQSHPLLADPEAAKLE